jgi:hypothetical protein
MTDSETAEFDSEFASSKFPVFRTLLCWLLFICVSCALNLLQLFINAVYVEPIVVTVDGLGASDTKSVAVTLVRLASKSGTGNAPEVPAFRRPDSFTWTWNSFWIEHIHVHATEDSLEHIKSVTVQIGNSTEKFDHGAVMSWRKNKPLAWAMPELQNPKALCLTVPWKKHDIALNMPDLTFLLIQALLPGTILATTFSILLFVIFRHRRKILLKMRKLLNEPEPVEKTKFLSPELAAGFVVVVLGLAVQYLFDRYAFTQDDNFCQFLPVVIQSAKTIAGGHIPVWNPYQLLGSPTMSVGTYALTYLPTYASYWIAHSCGNDLWTYEIFCNVHLLLAYFTTVWALRRARISTPLAVAGAVCWTLSGWFLVGGRSQSNFAPYALFLPLLIDCLNQLINRGGSTRWVGWAGLLVGILFHAGHAEFWAYTMMLFGFAVIVLTASRAITSNSFLYVCSALALGLALAAPLLVIQILETTNISRQGGASWSVDILPLLLPLGPFGYSNFTLGSIDYRFGTELYYAGTIFTAVGIAAFAVWVATGVFDRQIFNTETLRKNIWLFAGGLAFLLCLGAPAILWSALALLPFFEKFRWSIKYIPFMQIFFIFAGAAILERSISLREKQVVLGTSILLMLVHALLCRSSLYTFADRSYPNLPPKLVQAIGENRIFSAAPFRSPTKNFVQSMTLNFPTVSAISCATGYDTFISTKPEYERFMLRLYSKSVEAAQAYGLGTLFCADTLENPVASGNPSEQIVEVASDRLLQTSYELKNSGHLIDSSPGRKVYVLKPCDPLVFVGELSQRSLPFTVDQAGLYIDTRGVAAGTKLTVNFLRWPWMQAHGNGAFIPIKADEWERITLTLPDTMQKVQITYEPPWRISFAAAAVIALLATGLLFMAKASDSNQKEHKC